MRTMLRWRIAAAPGNRAIESGALSEAVEDLKQKLRPEALYFYLECGERAGCMVFDMTEPAQVAKLAEPLFKAADAAVEIFPVMGPEDMKKGLE